LPNYPSVFQVFRLYKLHDSTNEWKLASVPSTRFKEYNGSTNNEQSTMKPKGAYSMGEITAMPSVKEYKKWAITFPVYEIMNTHISSSFTIGALSGVATSMFVGHSGLFNAGVVSNESLAISVLVAAVVVLTIQILGLYGRTENKMHSLTLAKYKPKTVATLVAVLGAAAVVIQLEPFSDDDGATAITYWVGVGALAVNICLTVGLSVWAKLEHTRT